MEGYGDRWRDTGLAGGIWGWAEGYGDRWRDLGVDGGIWGRWSDMGVDGGRRLIYMGREGFKKEIVSNEQFQD